MGNNRIGMERNMKKKGTTMERITQLTERLANLLELKKAELKGDKSKSYIADLNDSIAGCERELAFLNKNPGGVTMVNGV